MKNLRILLLLTVALCLTPEFGLATSAEHGPSPEINAEATSEKVEIARLRIDNSVGGVIEGSRDSGLTWQAIGHVLTPTVKVNRKGFNASKYAPPGTVAATAVNAIHLKASQNVEENRGVIWTLSPAAETAAGQVSLQSEVSPGSTVYTDIPGGGGIFGGPFTPFVGNPIYLDNAKNNTLTPLPAEYVPKVGDVWCISIQRPKRYPSEIIFENRFGGFITIRYHNEEPRIIGQVLRPVEGVGRFVGSYFAEVGRLRANHCGVIDISTSPRGKIGSFQIVPANHAMSDETHYIREMTQWMVVGPVSALDPSWEDTAPLYSSFLRPRYDANDINDDWVEGLAGRFYFDCKMRGANGQEGDWQPLPTLYMEPGAPLPDWAGTALSKMTKLRIVFPFVWDTPLKTTPAAAPTAPAQ